MSVYRCVVCLRPRPRKWWQVGPLRPLAVCHHRDGLSCQQIADRARRTR